MHVDIISIFPEMFQALEGYGIPARAIAKSALEVAVWNPRDFTEDAHRMVDDRPYGGGPGMVMMAEPLSQAIDAAKAASPEAPVVYLSPQGAPLTQAKVRELAELPSLILLAGRYEGVDERLIESRVDAELSIGDYVLAGGEFPAMVLVEAISRLLPGVLGNTDSALQDSFGADNLLDCPHYTRPEMFEGRAVPAVLLSGHHEKIKQWRHEQALARTQARRPDLLAGASVSRTDQD